jgi:hypothetical protein
MSFQPAGISNWSAGIGAALIEVVSMVMTASWVMLGGVSAAGVAAGALADFFANSPLASLFVKAPAADPKMRPAVLLPAAFAAACPAADCASPAVELAAA